MYTSVNPNFNTYVGCRWVYITRTCYHNVFCFIKVTFQPETSICCTNLLRIDMEFGMTKTGHLFNFAADPTSVGLGIILDNI